MNKNNNKGQISIYLIIAIIIILGSILFIVFSGDKNESAIKEDMDIITLGEANLNSVEEFVERCIEYEIEHGLIDVGYDDLDELEAYLVDGLKICTNFSDVEEFNGVEVDKGDIKAKLSFTNDKENLIVELDYPVTISEIGSGKVSTITNYKISEPIKNSVDLKYDDDGKISQKANLISADKRLSLIIEEGTVIKQNGVEVQLEELELSIEDKSTYNSHNSNIIGNLVYNIEPENLSFHPPLIAKYNYLDENLFTYIDEELEEELYIGVYDEESNTWIKINGSTIDVEKNEIIFNITNSSIIAIHTNSTSNSSIETGDDSDWIPTTCGNSFPLLHTPTSWCEMDCTTNTACPTGTINCDCSGPCGTGTLDRCKAQESSVGGGVGDFNCVEVMDSKYTDGFFTLYSHENDLYAGAFGYATVDKGSKRFGHPEQSMIFSLNKSEIKPGITAIGESIHNLIFYNGKYYANTENQGKIYSSFDGETWTEDYDNTPSSGCGLVEYKDNLYAGNYDSGYNGKILSLSTEDGSWNVIKSIPGFYLKHLNVFNGALYAFGSTSDSKTGKLFIMTQKDNGEQNWKEVNMDNKLVISSHVWNSTFWLTTRNLIAFGKPNVGEVGVFKYDGAGVINSHNDLEKVYDGDGMPYVTDAQDWKGNLFASTSAGWKTQDGPSHLKYSNDLGETWKNACTFGETAVRDIEVHEGELYVATWDFGNGGKVYKVEEKEKITNAGGEFHHINPQSFHGEGTALVACMDGVELTSCSVNGQDMYYHGLDYCRKVFNIIGYHAEVGEIIECSGPDGNYEFIVESGTDMTQGDCWGIKCSVE